jgi:hypothetical protein
MLQCRSLGDPPHPPNPRAHPSAAFRALAAKFDFSRYSTLRDIGGSAATLACAVAAAHPHMRCASADLPALLGAAREGVARAGLEGRVEAEAVNFFSEEPFRPADVITMSMILHDCEPEGARDARRRGAVGWAVAG